MVSPERPNAQREVDVLLHNARLRDELEPFFDESVSLVDTKRMPTSAENEFLESMLAWERAPVLPISRWFQPELELPPPDALDDDRLRWVLSDTIERLHEKRISLHFTDHLSDRQLYCLICRDILPSHEKMIDSSQAALDWYCLDVNNEPETWLRYYASHAEREIWAHETGLTPPAPEVPPHPRHLPGHET